MNLSNEQIEELKMKLLEEKKRILSHLKSAEKDFDLAIDDTDDIANEEEEFANYLGLEQTEEDAIHHIDVALEKIKDGTYGVCEQCGNPISYELLSIEPESELCKTCKLSEKPIV